MSNKWTKNFYSENFRRQRRAETPLPPQAGRPRTRGECHPTSGLPNAARPCPWVGCRHHLLIEVTPGGSIQTTDADFLGELSRRKFTCSLDLADTSTMPLKSIARELNISELQVGIILKKIIDKFRATYDRKGSLMLTKGERS